MEGDFWQQLASAEIWKQYVISSPSFRCLRKLYTISLTKVTYIRQITMCCARDANTLHDQTCSHKHLQKQVKISSRDSLGLA